VFASAPPPFPSYGGWGWLADLGVGRPVVGGVCLEAARQLDRSDLVRGGA